MSKRELMIAHRPATLLAEGARLGRHEVYGQLG
jgi:hypothetical protein